jgi:hypothetical protein
VRLPSGAILTALLGCIPRGSDHGDRGDHTRARRAPLEDREMSVCSTKTRTAALSVRTRWRPGPWYGSRRMVRSISEGDRRRAGGSRVTNSPKSRSRSSRNQRDVGPASHLWSRRKHACRQATTSMGTTKIMLRTPAKLTASISD